MRLPAQSLTTADYKHMVVAAIVKYQIRDVRPFMLDVWDATDVLADVTMGAIKTVVNRSDHESLIGEDAERSVLELVRKDVNRYGFQILRVTFTDVAAVKSLRLLGGTPVQNVDN
jgi:regulator of protease activity HflC (stomatin/prohibitin superfamily)